MGPCPGRSSACSRSGRRTGNRKVRIRVSLNFTGALDPGDRIDRVIKAMSKGIGLTYEEALAMMNSRVALGRMVKPEEIAALAVFLASDKSGGITGQTINCCGGMEMN